MQDSFDDQRLAFGRVAELYDRFRPSFPEAVVDAVVTAGRLRTRAGLPGGGRGTNKDRDSGGARDESGGPDRIVEVGAGTGKATVMFARRGLGVVALEPHGEMARVARANCSGYPDVEVIETEFETWRPTLAVRALVSAQAWHWIAPDVRYERAARSLVPGGVLAAIWTFPDWGACALREPLSRVYRELEPSMVPDFPMHPDSAPTRLAGDWESESAANGLFERPSVTIYPWSARYTGADYAGLLATHQDHILLAPERREALLGAVADTIERAGGWIAMPFVTHVCLAMRAP